MESNRAEASLISPEFVGPPPRTIRLTGSGIALAVGTAVVVVIAIIWTCSIAIEAARQLEIRTALRGASNETIGKIEGLRNPFHDLKEDVEYTFTADGKTYTGEAIVPLEDYRGIGLTSSLAIRYLPENPAVNHPVDWEWSAMSELELYFVVVLVAGLGFSLFILPRMKFERRVAAEGVATFGMVTKCMVSGRRGNFVDLKYEFRTQDDALVRGRGTFQTRQEIGTKILVLYLPQKPRRNIPYPLSSWRIVKR